VFQLFDYLEYKDVRLVFAPPSMVGNFGVEADNWMWPRHSGDFTLLRVYAGPDGKPADYAEDNEPLQPERWLEVNPTGVNGGAVWGQAWALNVATGEVIAKTKHQHRAVVKRWLARHPRFQFHFTPTYAHSESGEQTGSWTSESTSISSSSPSPPRTR